MVPGPCVLFVIGRGMALGRRAALATVVGNAAGVYVQIVFVVLGAGAVVERSGAVFTVIKLVGAAYLVVLSVRAIRHRHRLAHVIDAAVEPRSVGRLPQFVDHSLGHPALQMLTLGLIFVAIALVSDGMWGLAAGSARVWLGRSPRRLAAIGGTSGVVMIGLGLGLAVTGKKD